MDRKARLDEEYVFVWRAPKPLTGTPKLSLHLPSGLLELDLEAIHATAEISEVSNDQRSLVAPGLIADDAEGAAGRYGRAWLITEEAGAFPVHISNIEDGEVLLAEPLQRRIEGGAQLQWTTWSKLLPEDVTAELRRNIRWDVVYVEIFGDDIFSRPDQVEDGLFHVVLSPFSTGLTVGGLTAAFSELSSYVRSGRQDFAEEIQLTEEMLISRIRAKLKGEYNEDDIRSGSVFRAAHAHLTAALILEPMEQHFERARSLRARGLALAEEALLSLPWLDKDGDGEPSEGETNQAISSALPCGTFTSTVERVFTRGRLP